MGVRAAGFLTRCAAVGALATALAACSEKEALVAEFGAADCARLSLIDERTGAPVVGAEDFAIDRKGRRLFVSAFDRRAVDEAVNAGDTPPGGGLYAVPFEALSAEEPVRVTSLSDGLFAAADFRPHGVTITEIDGETIVGAINRRYEKDGRRLVRAPQIAIFAETADGWALGPDNGVPAHCNANDLIVESKESILVSYDHEACGGAAMWEDIFGQRKSGAYRIRFRENWRSEISAAHGVGVANGLLEHANGTSLLAATRENRIRIIASNGVEQKPIKTPGGPDNLTVSDDGEIVAAVHPDLLGIWRHLKLGEMTAPSRVVKTSDRGGAPKILFDDPSGDVFSATTVAAEIDGRLVMGSVTEPGLLVCGGAGAPVEAPADLSETPTDA